VSERFGVDQGFDGTRHAPILPAATAATAGGPRPA